MDVWQNEIEKQVDLNLKDINEKDYLFFRIDEFKRNIARVGLFSESCAICKNEKRNIENIVPDIAEAISLPGKKRREYDRLIARISKHMRKEHCFFPPYYFSYLFAFFGVVAGSILGFILSLFSAHMKIELFLIGFACAIVVTYIFGALKDKKIRQEKRLM